MAQSGLYFRRALSPSPGFPSGSVCSDHHPLMTARCNHYRFTAALIRIGGRKSLETQIEARDINGGIHHLRNRNKSDGETNGGSGRTAPGEDPGFAANGKVGLGGVTRICETNLIESEYNQPESRTDGAKVHPADGTCTRVGRYRAGEGGGLSHRAGLLWVPFRRPLNSTSTTARRQLPRPYRQFGKRRIHQNQVPILVSR